MNLTIPRDILRDPLQLVIGVVERRQTMPILANVLFTLDKDVLAITATDTEIELISKISLESPQELGQVTVSARKLFDICRSLPPGADMHFTGDEGRLIVRSGRSRFVLATLPVEDFPNFEESQTHLELVLPQQELLHLLQQTHFAMAQQDVRYYLNGLLLEIKDNCIRAVSTDGHRFAMSTLQTALGDHAPIQVILPRKGVLELMRLLKNEESASVRPEEAREGVTLTIGENHLRVRSPTFTFTSKLIDGRFPDYERVLPKDAGKSLLINRSSLKEALIRAAILSNEKFRALRLQLSNGELHMLANNPEQEEAEEILTVDYAGEDLDIAFNVGYLLDALNAIAGEEVKLTFTDANSRIFIEDAQGSNSLFLVMPMQL
jgi:DNA polymerase-3 subunit beta